MRRARSASRSSAERSALSCAAILACRLLSSSSCAAVLSASISPAISSIRSDGMRPIWPSTTVASVSSILAAARRKVSSPSWQATV
jgi:hypothetical protein